jgi:hypothetical protein
MGISVVFEIKRADGEMGEYTGDRANGAKSVIHLRKGETVSSAYNQTTEVIQSSRSEEIRTPETAKPSIGLPVTAPDTPSSRGTPPKLPTDPSRGC